MSCHSSRKCCNSKCRCHKVINKSIDFACCPSAPGLVLNPQDANPCDADNALWVRNDDPSNLVFTDSNGVDHDITANNPLFGWWLVTSKSSNTNLSILWHIYNDAGILTVKLYAGYQGRYREWTPEDKALVAPDAGSLGGLETYLPEVFPLFPVNPLSIGAHPTKGQTYYLINPTPVTSSKYLSILQQQAYFILLGDKKTAYYWFYGPNYMNSTEITNALCKLVKLDNPPNIETFENSSFIDVNNPVDILTTIFKTQTLVGNPQMTVIDKPTDFPGFPQLQAQFQKLLTTGVSYKSTVKDVWRTRIPSATTSNYPIRTSLLTNEPPYARIGAHVYVDGFLGPYAVLNNTTTGWELGIGDNNNPRFGAEVYGPDYYVGKNEKYIITLFNPDYTVLPANNPLDTSALPPYDPAIHGQGKVEIRIPPVTPATEYSDLFAAAIDLMSTADRSSHNNILGYVNNTTRNLYHTFAEVQAGLQAGTALTAPCFSRGIRIARTLWAYFNIFLSPSFAAPMIPTNDPTGMSIREAKFNYNINLGNYIDPNNTYNIYWGLTGPEIPGQPVTGPRLPALTGNYYKTPGSKFVFQGVNYYAPAPDPTFWSIYGNDKNLMVYGLFKASKTNGVKVGYIWISGNRSPDRTYNASLYPEFSPGLPPGTVPQSDAFALMFDFFNSNNVQSIIIDSTNNSGGLGSINYNLASFVGGNRPGFKNIMQFSGNGYQPGLSYQQIYDTIEIDALKQNVDNAAIIDCDSQALRHPTAMFRGTGKKIIFMTSTNSASGGDQLPHFFRNSNGPDPTDLGFGVHSYLIGDIDGRLFAAVSPTLDLFTNESSNLTNPAGIKVSPLRLTIEVGSSRARVGEHPYSLNDQNPIVKPDYLYDGDIEATFWLDTGYKGIYPKNPIDGGLDPLVLPLAAGVTQPDKNNNLTWRNRCLEGGIIIALNGPLLSYDEVPESQELISSDHYTKYIEANPVEVDELSFPFYL